MGDPAGVGPEICVKALANGEIYKKTVPIIVGECDAIKSALQPCKLDFRVN